MCHAIVTINPPQSNGETRATQFRMLPPRDSPESIQKDSSKSIQKDSSESIQKDSSESIQKDSTVTIKFNLERDNRTLSSEITIPYEETFGEELLQRWPFAGFNMILDRDPPAVIAATDKPSSIGTRQLSLQQGDHIHVRAPRTVMIGTNLCAPREQAVTASVNLALPQHWEFSTYFPKVHVTGHTELEITWNVNTRENWALSEIITHSNLNVAHLFLEARAQHGSNVGVVPEVVSVTPNDSALLPVESITRYLDSVLRTLRLPSEARNAFITYWLPLMLAGKAPSIALRFVSQTNLAKFMTTTIDPIPDVVTRVFMFWKGVDATTAKGPEWDEARKRAKDPTRWRSVVDVDKKADDDTLFRVLQWGGMEVVDYRDINSDNSDDIKTDDGKNKNTSSSNSKNDQV